MAYISASSVKATIVKELVAGELATSGKRFELPRKAGSSLPVKTGGEIPSDTIRPGLNSNGARRGIQAVSTSIEMNAISAEVVDLLLESALSGEFDENGVLKAGEKFTTYSYISELTSGDFEINTGCINDSFVLTAEAAAGVTMTFGSVGTKQVIASTVTGTHTATAIPLEAYEYMGSEVLNIVAAGSTTLKYSSLSLNVTSPRTARNTLSSDTSLGFSSGAREVTLSMTIYREAGVDYGALFTGAVQTFAFDLGPEGYGRKFTAYGTAAVPQSETGDDMMINVEVTGSYDPTEGTALKVERLEP